MAAEPAGGAGEALEGRRNDAAIGDGLGEKAAVVDENIKVGGTEETGEAVENPLAAAKTDEPIMGQGNRFVGEGVYHRRMSLSEDQRGARAGTAANRLGLDYAAEASRLPPLPVPITDVHAHINGREAVAVYRRVAERYGIQMTYSMTKLEEVEAIRESLEGRVRFIAVPNYWSKEDRKHHMGEGFIKRVEAYHALGARIAKFWAAPRARDYGIEMGDPGLMRLDAPHRIEAMRAASALGMVFMVHVADPDTWFATRYRDAARYGTKREQYEPLERLLEEFGQPWIAAHMGGWPEDLEFLAGLLERYANLYLDTSATKWMVRELSKHRREQVVAFLRRFKGRILFGSDIVTDDEHLRQSEEGTHEISGQVNSPREAFDLYASRYWALRTLLEMGYEGESPIADPDLSMVDPERYGAMDAPVLRGLALPEDVLVSVYHMAAHDLLAGLHGDQ